MLHGFIDILVSQFSLQESANIRCLLSLCIEQAQPNARAITPWQSHQVTTNALCFAGMPKLVSVSM